MVAARDQRHAESTESGHERQHGAGEDPRSDQRKDDVTEYLPPVRPRDLPRLLDPPVQALERREGGDARVREVEPDVEEDEAVEGVVDGHGVSDPGDPAQQEEIEPPARPPEEEEAEGPDEAGHDEGHEDHEPEEAVPSPLLPEDQRQRHAQDDGAHGGRQGEAEGEEDHAAPVGVTEERRVVGESPRRPVSLRAEGEHHGEGERVAEEPREGGEGREQEREGGEDAYGKSSFACALM